MRDAIDDLGRRSGSQRLSRLSSIALEYPPDLQTLVAGVDVQSKKLKFLRRIPVDPMTGKAELGTMRSMQDDSNSDSWGGQNVFDVHSTSIATALDGTNAPIGGEL